ncbi:hypothetical protein F5Y18DRAFT_317388 [Xylariaceae sp. FL1019]|nr:hypothetical protein F5Y18DRAFT_317388 [Xylariaceae sp. FL1019]
MASLATALGLGATASHSLPNYAPAFLAWQWVYAYGILSSRTMKQIYGIDHNVSPREDLNKYGEAAVRSGKITQRQLGMMRRSESASANAVEGFTLFVAALGFATFTGVENHLINRAGVAYTLARLAYGAIYVLIDHPTWSQLRGIAWWIGNSSCLYLLWKAGAKLNAI